MKKINLSLAGLLILVTMLIGTGCATNGGTIVLALNLATSRSAATLIPGSDNDTKSVDTSGGADISPTIPLVP